MIRYDIYPDMKRRCVTLCFGVGHVNDERLADLLKEYQLKASFCLNKKEEHIDKISGKHFEKETVLENVHYKEALNLCEDFLNNMKFLKGNSILHIWGNSYELISEQEWEKLRKIFEKISGNKNIWYANQEEAYQYVVAQKELVTDMDETYFYNPTTTDIWIRKDNGENMCIPAGRKMNLDFSNERPFKTISSVEKRVGRFTIVQDRVEVQGVDCLYDYLRIAEGVCVLPFVGENILTIKQYRYPIRSWQRELPGGFIDEGESPQDAAIRELSEETGYTVKEIHSLGEFYPSFGSTNEKIHLFKAICGVAEDSHKEESEIISKEVISVDTLKEEIRNGKFMHGAGLAVWTKYVETERDSVSSQNHEK